MTPIDFLILGVVISSSNLAVALALGAMGQAARCFRVMLVFGLFEFVMPLLGIGLGAATARAIGLQANVVGTVLLIALGLLTVIGGIRNRPQDEKLVFPTIFDHPLVFTSPFPREWPWNGPDFSENGPTWSWMDLEARIRAESGGPGFLKKES